MRAAYFLLAVEGAFLLLWSSGFIGAKYGLAHAGTFTLLFYRYLLVSLVLFFWLVARGQLRFGSKKQIWRAAAMGILAHAIWLVAVLEATKYGAPPGIVALVASLQPLLTGIAAWPVLGERVSRLQWAGLFLGFIGVAFVVSDRIGGGGDAPWWAYCLPLISAVSLTWATVWQRSLEIKAEGFLPVPQNLAIQCWTSTAVLFPFALGAEGMYAEWNGDFIFALFWLAFIISLAAYGLLIFLFKHCAASRVASLLYLTPPTTMVMDYLAFGNVIAIFGLIGLAIACLGVVLTHKGEKSI